MADGQSYIPILKRNPHWPLKDIEIPHINDVLCGRGGGTNQHHGNEQYRRIVNETKYRYLSSNKRGKPVIARELVATIYNFDPPGRFLEKNENTNQHHDIGEEKAVQKVSQALREGAPAIREKIKADRAAKEKGEAYASTSWVSNSVSRDSEDSYADHEVTAREHHRIRSGGSSSFECVSPVAMQRHRRAQSGGSVASSPNSPVPSPRRISGSGTPPLPVAPHPMQQAYNYGPYPHHQRQPYAYNYDGHGYDRNVYDGWYPQPGYPTPQGPSYPHPVPILTQQPQLPHCYQPEGPRHMNQRHRMNSAPNTMPSAEEYQTYPDPVSLETRRSSYSHPAPDPVSLEARRSSYSHTQPHQKFHQLPPDGIDPDTESRLINDGPAGQCNGTSYDEEDDYPNDPRPSRPSMVDHAMDSLKSLQVDEEKDDGAVANGFRSHVERRRGMFTHNSLELPSDCDDNYDQATEAARRAVTEMPNNQQTSNFTPFFDNEETDESTLMQRFVRPGLHGRQNSRRSITRQASTTSNKSIGTFVMDDIVSIGDLTDFDDIEELAGDETGLADAGDTERGTRRDFGRQRSNDSMQFSVRSLQSIMSTSA